MFTGIITHRGTVTDKSRSKITIRTSRRLLHKLHTGASISVDGACLTVVAKKKNSFSADIMPETAKRTILGNLERGASVNLELPATLATFLSGHVVQGHIDGLGTLKEIRKHGTQYTLSIAVPRTLSRYIVPKGSVAINGISLTVIEAQSSRFTVGIIPHTWDVTMLHELVPGNRVNIEMDVLAKYIEKFVRKHSV